MSSRRAFVLCWVLAALPASPLAAEPTADELAPCQMNPGEPSLCEPFWPECTCDWDEELSVDDCGCFRTDTVELTECAATDVIYTGVTCGNQAAWKGTMAGGLKEVEMTLVPHTARRLILTFGYPVGVKPLPAPNGVEISEILYGLFTLAKGYSREHVPERVVTESTGGTWLTEAMGDKVVSEGEVDVDWMLEVQEYESLEVHGFYIVLGDLKVSGACDVDGMVYVRGKLTCGELTIKGKGFAGVTVSGLVFANPLEVTKVDATDAIVQTRSLWTLRGGGLLAKESATFTRTIVDAGPSLVVGTGAARGPLTLDDGCTAMAERVEASALRMTDGTLDRVSSIEADSLTLDRSSVTGGGSLEIDVTGRSALDLSSITASDVDLETEELVMHDGGVEATAQPPSGLTLPSDEPPGETMLGHDQVFGASYGGYGGTEASMNVNSFRPAKGHPSGNPLDPTGRGVSGWALPAADSSKGGGAGGYVRLKARGAMTLQRVVFRADGGSAPFDPEGGGGSGGSGGTIRLEAAALDGTAMFFANGGDGSYAANGDTVFNTGGGGSGGRIGVFADRLGETDFQFEALGGRGGITGPIEHYPDPPDPWADWRAHGGPGTYVEREKGQPARLLIDGAGVRPTGPCDRPRPDCRGVGWLPAELGDTDVIVRHATLALSGFSARSLTLEDAVVFPDDPRVRLAWRLPSYEYQPGSLPVAQTIYPLAVWAEPLDEKLTLQVTNDLVVDAASHIDVSGLGGYSRNTPDELLDRSICWSGGSHGGLGGMGSAGGVPSIGDNPFGSETEPDTVGHGGCSDITWTGEPQQTCGLGGAGGGALRIIAGGTVRVDGSLAADGADGIAEDPDVYCITQQGTAGGAGGSIWLTADALEGSGTISARGGKGTANVAGTVCGGGGGGGRVAIHAANGGWEGRFDVSGAPACMGPGDEAERWKGGDGSLYRKAPAGGCAVAGASAACPWAEIALAIAALGALGVARRPRPATKTAKRGQD